MLWTFKAMLLLSLSPQEDYDHASSEDQHYQGDASMLSPKAKLLLRDSKKELLRYATLKKETSGGIFTQSAVNNASFPFSWQMVSIDDKKCNAKPYLCLNRTV